MAEIRLTRVKMLPSPLGFDARNVVLADPEAEGYFGLGTRGVKNSEHVARRTSYFSHLPAPSQRRLVRAASRATTRLQPAFFYHNLSRRAPLREGSFSHG
jgi:hypothetical protein